MGTFGTNRVHSVGRMVKVADRMRWGIAPAWVRFPPYLTCKIHHNFSREANCVRVLTCPCKQQDIINILISRIEALET